MTWYKPTFMSRAMQEDEPFLRDWASHMVEEYGAVLFIPTAPLGAGEPSPATRDRVGEALGAEQGPHPVRPSPAPSGGCIMEYCDWCAAHIESEGHVDGCRFA